jgi:hypothetical protein
MLFPLKKPLKFDANARFAFHEVCGDAGDPRGQAALGSKCPFGKLHLHFFYVICQDWAIATCIQEESDGKKDSEHNTRRSGGG